MTDIHTYDTSSNHCGKESKVTAACLSVWSRDRGKFKSQGLISHFSCVKDFINLFDECSG